MQTYSPTLVVKDYVPSSQVHVPNLNNIVESANAGDAVSQYKLGEMYYNGLGVPKNHKKAQALWHLASVSGYAPAQYALGILYFHGVGIKTDFIEGCKWLNLAALQGYSYAIYEHQNKCSR